MPSFPPVSLIGAPTDIGAGHRGASMGPEALRVAGIAARLAARGLDVRDGGNLTGPVNPWQPPQDGYRHLPEVVAWNRAVLDAVYAELASGRLPILLGGVRMGVTLCVIGAVVGEFVGADTGLGALVNIARGLYDTPLMFVAIIALMVLAMTLYFTVGLLERLTAPR